MIAVARAFARTERRALLRSPISIVFFFGLPAVMSAILGPAVTGLRGPGATARATLGFAVMFAFMTVNYVGRSLFREFHAHTWRRTAIAAPPRTVFLVGKCAPVFLVAVGQLVVFSAVALAFLDLRLDAGLLLGAPVLGLILVLHAASGVATGMALFALVQRAEAFFSLTYLVLITFATLGGAVVAPSRLPAWSRALGMATPHHWSMRALDEVTRGSGDAAVVASSAAVLVAFVLLAGGLAVVRLDLRQERQADA